MTPPDRANDPSRRPDIEAVKSKFDWIGTGKHVSVAQSQHGHHYTDPEKFDEGKTSSPNRDGEYVPETRAANRHNMASDYQWMRGTVSTTSTRPFGLKDGLEGLIRQYGSPGVRAKGINN